jgi:hypothetical protein
MGVIKKIFTKPKLDKTYIEEAEISEPKLCETFIEEAEKAAEIVAVGIEKGELETINDELENLPSSKTEREQYVFVRHGYTVEILKVVFVLVLSICFAYFMIIGVGTVMYSDEYKMLGIMGIGVSVAVIVVNMFILASSIRKIRFYHRYDTYMNILKHRNIEIVDDLVSYSKKDAATVIRDLKKAIRYKYIPQGHFGTDNIIFITSEDVYDRYIEKQAVCDRYYRKQVEERARMKERSKEMAKIMEMGKNYVDKIHQSNDIIKDKVISQKLNRMETIVAMIFHEVDINPKQADNLGLFLNYYLPTTDKLLNAYIDLDEKQVKGKSLERAKKDIENLLDTINNSFEAILDRFYQEQEMDIASDISAMEIMMKQDGIK